MADLPMVTGPLACSLANLEARALRLIDEEQREASPDNALIGVLCDTVRCAREYASIVGKVPSGDNER